MLEKAPIGQMKNERARRSIIALLALALFAVIAAADSGYLGAVRYRSSDAVYLDAGGRAGLALGDRLLLVRREEVVGEIEIVFVADHSATGKILVEHRPIDADDEARRAGDIADGETDAERNGSGAERREASAEGGGRDSEREEPAPRRSPTRVSGTLAFDWESFTDEGEKGLDFDRFSGRLSLRLKEIAGTPLQARIRLRGQEIRRDPAAPNRLSLRQSKDRLYEAALIYEPPKGRFGFRLGRLGGGPFVGVGFMDGALGQVSLSKKVAIGGFFGSRPDIADLGFESKGKKYGVFTRFRGLERETRPAFELFLAGIVEDGEEDVSREYVAVESRYAAGGRWTFHQRAEIDLNRGWREDLSASASQLSNFSFGATARFSERSRLTFSYDRFERYRTEETRFIPEEIFDDLLREGLRASYQFGKPGALTLTLQGGLRAREGDDDDATTYGVGLRHPDVGGWGLYLGGDVYGFSNSYNDGWIASLKGAKRFRGGHEVHLTVGARRSQSKTFSEALERENSWVRLGGWAELPMRLFLRSEVEIDRGDDLEGRRITLGLGYRF